MSGCPIRKIQTGNSSGKIHNLRQRALCRLIDHLAARRTCVGIHCRSDSLLINNADHEDTRLLFIDIGIALQRQNLFQMLLEIPGISAEFDLLRRGIGSNIRVGGRTFLRNSRRGRDIRREDFRFGDRFRLRIRRQARGSGLGLACVGYLNLRGMAILGYARFRWRSAGGQQ